MTERQKATTTPRGVQVLAGLFLGLVPGLLLVLIAQFVITGEAQLTVGTAGLWLAAAGGGTGLLIAYRRSRRDRQGRQ
ncbi:MAG: hypothetical protein M3253_07000 [Chloroflexota bacterium]|nr:hypothetical protein [Chloroflexota bacterium]